MKKIFVACILIISILAYGIIEINFGCPFRSFTGIPCPGCGLTRATLSALTGNFEKAFFYHPLFLAPYLLLFYGVVVFFKIKTKKAEEIFYIVSIVVAVTFVIVYLIRILNNQIL